MNRRVSTPVRALIYVALALFSLVAIYPVWFAVLASGRLGQRLYTLDLLGMFVPSEWTFDNYQRMLTQEGFLTWVRNSLFVAGATMLICLVVSTSAAFAFSRFKFRGRNFLLVLFLAIQAFPAVLSLVPKTQILSAIGLYRNPWGLILAYVSSTLVFTTWNLKGYFDTLPIDLEEAGMIDGAGPLQSFLLIALPLARPAIAVTALFAFMAGWGEYVLSSVLIPAPVSAQTLMVGMYTLADPTGEGAKWGVFAAGAVMVMIPVLLVFLYVQQYLESGLTLGGVKG
jgi:arabinogalactan oligomer/maltooligosaccharide transport system permease protein